MTVLLRVECADGIIPVRRDIFIQADLTWDDALLAHCIEKLLGLAPGHIRMYIFDASAGGKTEIVKDATLAAQNVTADSRLYIERVGSASGGAAGTGGHAAAATWEAFVANLKECPDDEGIYRFFASIKTATITSVAGAVGINTAVLEFGTPLLGDATRGTSVYIRDSYIQLLKEFSNEPLKRFWVVTGTPGTGKSLFAFYLLHQFSQQNRAIVYEYSSTGDDAVRRTVVLFQGKVYELMTREQTVQALSLPVVYICDALAPWDTSHGKSLTIVVTSPKPSRYKEWAKQHNILPRYMPLWSLEELQQCATVCGLCLSGDLLLQRVSRWGGVARAVLQDGTVADKDDVERFEQAIQSTQAQTAFDAIMQLDTISCDRVIHMDVPRDADGAWMLTTYTEVFASSMVAQRMRIKLFRHNAVEALRIVEQAQTSPQLRGLAGYMFEPFVLRRFVGGGLFVLRQLCAPDGPRSAKKSRLESGLATASGSAASAVASSEWQLLVPVLREVLYEPGTLATVLAARDQTQGTALVPRAPNEPLLDFAVRIAGQPPLAVQVTATTAHGVSMSALTSYAASIPTGADIHLVFAVPSHMANDFPWQTLRTKSNTVWKGTIDSHQVDVVARLKQWVVGIPVSTAEEDARQVRNDVARRG